MRIGELARRAGVNHCTCGAAYLARGGRDPQLGTLLHVTNGESAGNTLRQTALGGAVLSWQDVLHEGPVPDVPAAELRRARARFLSECGWGSERSLLDAFERRDRLYEHALDASTQVVLWFEHDLYDQLQLLQVLAAAREGVELIQADDHLGPLAAGELEALWPQRVPVTAEMLALPREAWAAFRAPEPTGLAALLDRDTSALPHLGSALRRLLEELPDAESGLSRTERQLLQPLLDGPRRPPELFAANQASEEAPFAGDAWVWKRLAELQPLVDELPPPPPLGDAHAFAATRVSLTGLGREVLAGKADRVEVAPLERWLGGTQLGGERDWRWDRAAGVLRG
jgi:Domain of unknown function (DUF1835)